MLTGILVTYLIGLVVFGVIFAFITWLGYDETLTKAEGKRRVVVFAVIMASLAWPAAVCAIVRNGIATRNALKKKLSEAQEIKDKI